MDVVAILIVVGVAASLVGILAMARRRRWNADGSDDERRRRRGLP